jgi:alkylation response protein AidB-like acyl-CoA dehydrogenase
LGTDGDGLNTMLQIVLPLFNLMNAACSLGTAAAALEAAIGHVSKVQFEHTSSTIAELPTIRAQLAKAQIKVDTLKLLIQDTAAAMVSGRADTMLRVLEVKALANETALEVAQTAMRVCGGAAFRDDVAVGRRLRDAEAGFIMAPTADQLYDFIGKAICGMPVF